MKTLIVERFSNSKARNNDHCFHISFFVLFSGINWFLHQEIKEIKAKREQSGEILSGIPWFKFIRLLCLTGSILIISPILQLLFPKPTCSNDFVPLCYLLNKIHEFIGNYIAVLTIIGIGLLCICTIAMNHYEEKYLKVDDAGQTALTPKRNKDKTWSEGMSQVGKFTRYLIIAVLAISAMKFVIESIDTVQAESAAAQGLPVPISIAIPIELLMFLASLTATAQVVLLWLSSQIGFLTISLNFETAFKNLSAWVNYITLASIFIAANSLLLIHSDNSFSSPTIIFALPATGLLVGFIIGIASFSTSLLTETEVNRVTALKILGMQAVPAVITFFSFTNEIVTCDGLLCQFPIDRTFNPSLGGNALTIPLFQLCVLNIGIFALFFGYDFLKRIMPQNVQSFVISTKRICSSITCRFSASLKRVVEGFTKQD